jgi:membrane protease YdiL (CAAX protease family)
VARTGEPSPSATTRALVSGLVLALVWAAAFGLTALPFFPLIAAGGVITGLAGLWVRRAAPTPPSHGSPASSAHWLPTIRLRPGQAVLAVVVAVAHLAAAYLLFEVGTWVAPQLAPTAEQVYGRAEVSLWLAVLLGGVVTAPLEEIYWRGAIHPLLVGAARRQAPRLAGLPGVTPAMGALVYGAFHLVTGSAALVAAALLGGLVWSWLAERTGTVGAPMLAHAVWACGMLLLPPV